MKKNVLIVFLVILGHKSFCQSADSSFIANVYQEALANGEAYDRLRELCKNIGNRLAGSENADKAIEWGVSTMRKYGFDSVFTMPVSVPHWERGQKEVGYYFFQGKKIEPPIVALGGSVGTEKPVTGKIIEVKSIQELRNLDDNVVKGKIVFFNKAMDPMLINTGAAYGGAYDIRSKGPSEAAAKGAIGCLIRSLTLADDQYAHTGATSYVDSLPKIPAAALSSVDARELHHRLIEEKEIEFTLHLTCKNFPRKTQYNVIGEIRGSVHPEKIILVGGHLDSWDIGEGAHDDGAGVTQSIEVLRILKQLNYRPRHTIRAVLFINEEFGNDGGETYAAAMKERGVEHVAAIESDSGGLTPLGFNVQGNPEDLYQLRSWAPLLEPYQLYAFRQGWSGVDIGPLKTDNNVLFGLSVDSQRYFDFHHSANDIFENVNKRELLLGAAAMTSLIYLLDQNK